MKRLLKQAITTEQLPRIISRSLRSIYSNKNPRTLARDEAKGLLPRVKGKSRTVFYPKHDFLKYLGLVEEEIPVTTKSTKRRAAAV